MQTRILADGRRQPRVRRGAFTLVEMLVAMTLTIFLMVILSQAFIAGLETFSGLKAIGDLQEDMRSATTLLRYDLMQDHFEGKRRLSDPVLLSGNNADKIRQGFFAMGQGYPGLPYKPHATYPTAEGTEDGIASYRANNHWLHFTCKQRGNNPSKVYTAVDTTPIPPPPAPQPFQPLGNISSTILGNIGNPNNPGNQTSRQADALFDVAGQSLTNPLAAQQGHGICMSPWAEIAYVMVQTGTTTSPNSAATTGTPLYALYRLQYLVFPYTLDANSAGAKGNMDINAFKGFACNRDPSNTANIVFYSPADLASGSATRTFTPAAPAFGSVPRNSALVLSNVVSFHVQVATSQQAVTGNAASDYSDLLPGMNAQKQQVNKAFDTANYGFTASATVSQPSIQALRITIRVWDPKSRQTRQVSIVQDM